MRELVIDTLCLVRGDERTEIDRDIESHGGDVRIDSKEGEAVCVLVEEALGLGELVRASDLKPEELTCVSSLTRLFEERIADHHAAEGKDAA